MSFVFKPHAGAQTRFMSFEGRYALFGGAKGGGKSQCLLYDPFRQIKIEQDRVNRGEITISTGRAIYFRRTMPELREVITRSKRTFKQIDPGAEWIEAAKTWTFSCGYQYIFAQMEEDDDWLKYYGIEFSECVEVGTRVRMADGSLWPIEKVRPGDMVLTLEGPRPVVAVSTPRRKPCVRADVYRGRDVFASQVHPVDHPVLTISPAWRSGQASSSQVPSQVDPEALSWLSYESLSSSGQGTLANGAWSTSAGSGYAAFGDSLPAPSQPGALSVPVVLYAPDPPSGRQQSGTSHFCAIHRDDVPRAPFETGTHTGSPGGYPAGHGSCGELPLEEVSACREILRQLGRAEGRTRYGLRADDRGPSPSRSRLSLSTYVHPYTGAVLPVSADLAGDLVYGACTMTPIGSRSVVDVTIGGAHHYISESGLINRNCIFDELTQFTEKQFDELDLCLRSADPVLQKMLYMRAGTNPVGPGLPWVRDRFVEVAPPGTPVMRRVKTKIWKDGAVVGEKWVESQQIFIPARVEDNPSIDQAEYAALLSSKTPAMRRALLEGDWYVSESAFFADIWDPSIHICKPFNIPAGWYKFRSIDYGYVYPGMSSVQWWAVDPDGNMTCYRSYTCTGRSSLQLAEDIMFIERDAVEWDTRGGVSMLTGPLDLSCWGEHGHVGPTIAETLMNNGVHVFKCTKDRKGMADQMRIRLMKRSPHPTLTNPDGSPAMIVPGMRWFDTCWNFVRTPGGKKVKAGPIITIPVLPTDEDDPEKWDTDANDHDADSAGYAAMSRPINGLEEKKDKDGRLAYEAKLWGDDELAPRRRTGRMGMKGMW